MSQFEVGQALVYVPGDKRRGGPRPVVITAIGRKWVSVRGLAWSGARFDKHTLMVDGRGYSSPGQVYISLPEYEAEVELQNAWLELRNKVTSYHIPHGATAQRIRLALGLLRMGGDIDPLMVLLTTRDRLKRMSPQNALDKTDLEHVVGQLERLTGKATP